MAQDKRQTFLVISGDKSRIQRCTEIISKNFQSISVFHAGDWYQAKDKIDNLSPKIIFVDEYLPKGSGFEIVQKILKSNKNKDCSIIIMAYVADHDKFSSEVASGRVQFLTEPDKEHSVVECVSKIVSPNKNGGVDAQEQYELRRLAPGDFLFKEGDHTEIAYIVKKGSLRAYSESPDGEKVMLGEIVPGEFVGEMGHFNHEPRSATVQAITEVELIAIPNGALDEVIFTRPSWAKALVKTLSMRLKKANKALAG